MSEVEVFLQEHFVDYCCNIRGGTILYKLFIILTISMISQAVSALSIIYDGHRCAEPENFQSTHYNENDKYRSIFSVVSDEGGGYYKLTLFGGLPRFFDNLDGVCIEDELSIGYSKGLPTSEDIEKATINNRWLPEKLTSVPAIGYFNGRELIISLSSAYSGRDGGVNDGGLGVRTSTTIFNTNTLIFDHNPDSASFVLRNIILNSGLFSGGGPVIYPESYFEVLLPFEVKIIKKPSIKIEYFLGQ